MSLVTPVLAWGRHGPTPTILSIKSKTNANQRNQGIRIEWDPPPIAGVLCKVQGSVFGWDKESEVGPQQTAEHTPQPQGMRIEWDPPPVTRARPLSGFIIQLDQCTQAGTPNPEPSTRNSEP